MHLHNHSGNCCCFTDLSAGIIDSWLWDFGDGGTSSDSSPCHTYLTAGSYPVTLGVSGLNGTDTETKTGYIKVYSLEVKADFIATPLSGCVPLTVNFSDSSAGPALSWLWDFGDGDTSAVRNPAHIYLNPGAYSVSLTVSDTCGADSKAQTIKVIPCGGPVIITTPSPLPEGTVGIAYKEDLTVSGGFPPYTWSHIGGNFPPGLSLSSISGTPTQAGTFNFTLQVTDSSSPIQSDSRDFSITIHPCHITADFTLSDTTGCAPLTINFTDSSSGLITSWLWDFGDKSPLSTTQNPSHTYSDSDIYQVRLVVTGNCGSDSKTVYLEVPGSDLSVNFAAAPLEWLCPLECELY